MFLKVYYKISASINWRLRKIFPHILLNFHRKSNKVLIYRLDAIGDYILFRNFFKVIKESSKYQDKDLFFLGNIEYQDVFNKFDKQFFKDSFWLDKKRFYKDLFYHIKILFLMT